MASRWRSKVENPSGPNPGGLLLEQAPIAQPGTFLRPQYPPPEIPPWTAEPTRHIIVSSSAADRSTQLRGPVIKQGKRNSPFSKFSNPWMKLLRPNGRQRPNNISNIDQTNQLYPRAEYCFESRDWTIPSGSGVSVSQRAAIPCRPVDPRPPDENEEGRCMATPTQPTFLRAA